MLYSSEYEVEEEEALIKYDDWRRKGRNKNKIKFIPKNKYLKKFGMQILWFL